MMAETVSNKTMSNSAMSDEEIKSFGKVVVLAGGDSREREVSLQSGGEVFKALGEKNIDVTLLDTKNMNIDDLKQYDRAFIALHGPGGEDGEIQALLNFLDIPYTGCDVSAAAIGMDKVLTKKLWQAAGLPCAESKVVNSLDEAKAAVAALGLPVMFKPSLEGSSVGISKVSSEEQIEEAYTKANLPGQQILVEKFVVGDEYSVGIVGDIIYPSVRFTTKREFYDYQAKYVNDDNEYFCPSGLSEAEENEILATSKAAFDEIGCTGWGRIDFIRDESGEMFLLEINTVPGLTSHSLLPIEAKQLGTSFADLSVKILETSFARRRL